MKTGTTKKGKKLLLIVFIVVLLLSIGIGGWKLIDARDFQFFGGLINRVSTDQKVVALTFDDGPTKDYTDRILAMLQQQQVKATFFVTGRELELNLTEGQKIVAAGHELGNHTYSHERMVFKAPDFIQREVEMIDALIRKAGYRGEIHFRPPYGKKLLTLPYYLNQHQRKTIMWDVEPESFSEIADDAQKIVQHTLEHVRPGSIIILHLMYSSREASLKALPEIIEGLKQKGYNFKTVSELLTYQS